MKKTVILEKWKILEKKINSIISKLNKNGISCDFKYKVVSEPRKEVRRYTALFDNDETLGTDAKECKSEFTVIDIEFSGSLPVVNGWEFLGHVEKLPNKGKLVYGNVPLKYRDHDLKVCDHCNHRRNRNKVYILENNGVTKAVGSSCIKDFTGHGDPEALLALANLVDLIDARDKMEDVSYGKKVIEVISFIEECAQLIIDFNGYKKSNGDGPSTKDMALNTAIEVVVSKEAKKLAAESINRCKAFTPRDLENEFNYNLHTIANSEFVYSNQLGIASYMVEYHRVKREKEATREKELSETSNNHVGEIKNRLDFELTYISSNSFDNAYGTTYFHKFNDKDGNEITWKGSKSLNWACNEDLNLESTITNSEALYGRKMTLKGTITKHEEFRGRKNTIINRCKVVNLD